MFVHGWGFTPDFWAPVRSALDRTDGIDLDFGFFGPERMTARPSRPFVAVGHSLGALWLLRRRPEGCAGMVLINGFARFSAAVDFPAGVPPRVVGRMIQGLDQNADDVVLTFRRRAGIAADLPGPAQAERLAAGLAILRDEDARPALADAAIGRTMPPLAILAGGNDPIVTAEMTRACFSTRVPIEWVAEGGHLLPLTHPAICAAAISGMTRRGRVS
ncbi:alpha/beta fold hydrolase [Gluconacetobacter tumulisoli]|uniref:Alpha/beta fold hydrolase n=2 Tax=Gluconacetobacter tumulisoli TaxID=1286189 RepID=A0A7W4K7C3_9PROT|nr:alpha/beta hydrolase [Gluconacetobacter tumulisoli]MBB2201696.1 alpha/beta fold hydrolase [Gluconacetobacter tumulisoli]